MKASQGHADKPKESEPHPFDVFIASAIVLYALGFDCIYQDKPPAAYGLALVTAAAIAATPNFIFNSVTKHIAASPKRAHLSKWLRSATLRLMCIGIALGAISVILAKQHTFHITHTLVIVCVLASGVFMGLSGLFFAAYAVVSFGLASKVPDTDASRSQSFSAAWKGAASEDRLWFFAGCMFGTLIQFITT